MTNPVGQRLAEIGYITDSKLPNPLALTKTNSSGYHHIRVRGFADVE